MLTTILQLLFPSRCGGCDELGPAPFCPACAETLRPAPEGCARCGGALPAGLPHQREGGGGRVETCAGCATHPPPYAAVRAPFAYQGALALAVHALKYRSRPELAQPLGLLFAAAERPAAELICPIPLHPRRLRERGYDQAHLLSRELGRLCGLPIAPLLCRRIETRPQVGLDREGRRLNLAGAFVAEPAAKGRSVCLVDDVWTTGSTAEAAAQALLAAGARRVEVRTLCRA
jgi:ComF family protein